VFRAISRVIFTSAALAVLAACQPAPDPLVGSPSAALNVAAAQMKSAGTLPEQINLQRVNAGLPLLTRDSRLTAAAEAHALDMATMGTLTHIGSTGYTVGTRVRLQGYCYNVVSENIASGWKTVALVVRGWMDSPGHRANILNSQVSEYGVGRAGDYWVMIYGDPRPGDCSLF
jgi:uncharacterized protein YkwD